MVAKNVLSYFLNLVPSTCIIVYLFKPFKQLKRLKPSNP